LQGIVYTENMGWCFRDFENLVKHKQTKSNAAAAQNCRQQNETKWSVQWELNKALLADRCYNELTGSLLNHYCINDAQYDV
jgi:hypothetical protein